jgi:hypothetical protein
MDKYNKKYSPFGQRLQDVHLSITRFNKFKYELKFEFYNIMMMSSCIYNVKRNKLLINLKMISHLRKL